MKNKNYINKYKDGDIYYDIKTNKEYVFNKNKWIETIHLIVPKELELHIKNLLKEFYNN